MQGTMEITVSTLYGLENVLAEELKMFGAQDIQLQNRSVSFKGNQEMLYAANLTLRTALRVLKPIYKFTAFNEKKLYNSIREVNWADYLDKDDTLAVDSVVNSNFITHSKFAALKTKDAIVDQFRERTGKRPSIDVKNPTLRIHLHISGKNCTVALNSSGTSLHRRGYRLASRQAPLNEVLAAGLILLSGWDAKTDFIDPMCGSGTLLIEAAMLANKMPPGMLRKKFGFETWVDFDAGLWQKVRTKYMGKVCDGGIKIIGSDKSPLAVKVAKENVQRAGLEKNIDILIKRFEKLIPASPGGVLMFNPPYGERMQHADITSFYTMIGDHLKQNFVGFEVWIVSANKAALKHVGLRPSKKYTVFNGGLECRFQKYEMYSGSIKAKYRKSK